MPHVKAHPRTPQPVQPGTQQRRGFQVDREHAAGAADEGVDAQAVRPFPQGLRPERLQPGRHRAVRRAVAAEKGLDRLAVGEVQPALAGKQELAADRGHGVVHVDREAGLGQHLGGHQPGGAGADHGGAGRVN